MTTYVDSSALVAFYVTEAFSAAARRHITALAQVPFTALHDLEVRNAFLLLRGRRVITTPAWRALTAQLEDDLRANRLRWTPLDFIDVFTRARHLAESHTPRVLCRSLDLLHLAAAQALECTRLVSGDTRQLRLARALRMRAVDITRPGRAPSSTRRGRPSG